MKTETKHTPEPWTSEATSSSEFVTRAIRGPNGELVAHVGVPGYKDTPGVHQNVCDSSRIVACVNGCEGIADPSAVRELLEALEFLVRLMEQEGASEFVLGDARSAIAKARGTEGGAK